MKSLISSIILVFFLSSSSGKCQNFDGGFNFNLPWNDTLNSEFFPQFDNTPIGENDNIEISSDGHFLRNGIPTRFWGVNFTVGANFPTKTKASGIAGRLRKYGFNLVRFHHLDNGWSSETIFKSSESTREFDPERLDRLFYLIDNLKRNSIYVNVNLLVSRVFKAGDGVPEADSLSLEYKAPTIFDRQLIELQKEYARNLLTPVNPYTGLSLAQDPVTAMVEINNEAAFGLFWRGNGLKPFSRGGILTERHSRMLDSLWIRFLHDKYATTEGLHIAWNSGSKPRRENEIVDSSFETLSDSWFLSNLDTAHSTFDLDSSSAFSGKYCGRITVERVTGTSWHIQFGEYGLSMNKDSIYVIEFAGRASGQETISVTVQQSGSPYEYYGGQTFVLSNEWKKYKYSFKAPANEANLKVAFCLGYAEGIYYFDDVGFYESGLTGLDEGESLEDGNIARLDYSECNNFSDERVRDMSRFYVMVQEDYFKEMYLYLWDSLGVRAAITGTNWNFGFDDILAQSKMDYMDTHAYWDHPQFPNEPWSPTDWYIENEPMVYDTNGGTIPGFSCGVGIKNKPLTISEYNHIFPNIYQTEGPMFLCFYAALQDVDAIEFFEYNDDFDNWETDKVDGFFNIHRNSAIMALMPTLAYIFRNNLILSSDSLLPISLSRDDVLLLPKIDGSQWWSRGLLDKRVGIKKKVRIDTFDADSLFDYSDFNSNFRWDNYTADVDNGFLIWDTSGYIINQAKRYIAASGFFNKNHNIGMYPYYCIKQADGFCSVSLFNLDSTNDIFNVKFLLTISSRIENSNMVWDGNSTVHDNWGGTPTMIEPRIVELMININTTDTITLVKSLDLCRLDEKGQIFGDYVNIPPVSSSSNSVYNFVIDQNTNPSIWFAIVPYFATGIAEPGSDGGLSITALPNPCDNYTTINYTVPQRDMVELALYNLQGNPVKILLGGYSESGSYSIVMDTEELCGGVYFLRIRCGGDNKIAGICVNK